MRKKISCIVQARVNSKRLPGKILMPVFGKSLLQLLLERLKKLKTIDYLIVATTKHKLDDQTAKIAKLINVKIYRGDEHNVLKRYYDCAKINKSSIIIRVTADCPLIDIKYINELLKIFLKNDYDYLSNLDLNYLPDGFHCEIFNFRSLEKAQKLAKSKFDREHVTSFLWSNPKIFSIHHYCGKKLKNHSKDIRLTLDYHEDYILIKEVFEKLYKKNKFFSLVEITAFLEKNKSFLKINEKYHKLQWKKFHSKRN
jgi:spore coat polysaccharide biosynthesis protein SpsF